MGVFSLTHILTLVVPALLMVGILWVVLRNKK